MKTIKVLMLMAVIMSFSAAGLYAQSETEDVIYLKNGSVYRGVIIEQVPNVSMKIKTIGGNVFSVAIADVEKITKEDKPAEQMSHGYGYHRYGMMHGGYHGKDSTQQFRYRNRGGFMQMQVLVENIQGGVRMVHGYKFHQFAYIGIGVGADFVFSSPLNPQINNLNRRALSGVYIPFYLYYAGDFTRKRITPFYAIEAGYAIGAINRGHYHFEGFPSREDRVHGAVGSVGLGVKFNSKRRVHFSILMNLNAKNVNYNETITYFDINGTPYTVSEKKNATLLFPGIRFGLGF